MTPSSRSEVNVTVLWSFVASSLPVVLTGDFAEVSLSPLWELFKLEDTRFK